MNRRLCSRQVCRLLSGVSCEVIRHMHAHIARCKIDGADSRGPLRSGYLSLPVDSMMRRTILSVMLADFCT
jgi:hypothetical protein